MSLFLRREDPTDTPNFIYFKRLADGVVLIVTSRVNEPVTTKIIVTETTRVRTRVDTDGGRTGTKTGVVSLQGVSVEVSRDVIRLLTDETLVSKCVAPLDLRSHTETLTVSVPREE